MKTLYGVNQIQKNIMVSLSRQHKQKVNFNHEDGLQGVIYVFDTRENAEKFCPNGAFSLEVPDD